MKHKILILFLLILIAIFSFLGFRSTGSVVEYLPPSEQGSIDVYFCPRDDCEGVYTNLIKNSNNINCAIYDMDSIVEEFKQRNKDIDVKIVADNSNKLAIKDSDFIKFDNNNQLMHNKFCVFNQNDKNIILTGSLNPTDNGFNKNDNNLVVISSNYLSENYNQEFNELWNGIYGKGERVKYPKLKFNNFLIENYFCPEDNCEQKVFNLIKNAKSRIYFMTFSFTSNPLGDLIIERSKEDIEIKGLFDKFQNRKYSQYDKMKNNNVNVKLYGGELLHHKVFIVDNKVVFGSYNPTKSGNERNDENILIIHNSEITNKFIEEFNLLSKNGK
ncbi:MAG: phospholipase D-like domain-containing protein [Candidatus Nanoarchaeia archaeon]|jgi:phosphatidylserine/phosphatidylglycerophosphate/cardiolipin synthase-like enzyme|nr:phospholipase D-like domain-containing protein [Candidatus Nanoarchaeia archaeon]|tara:strand:- start:6358 stop:7344 length:987 start_codon:yes stop_codon:yes gene_type:complete